MLPTLFIIRIQSPSELAWIFFTSHITLNNIMGVHEASTVDKKMVKLSIKYGNENNLTNSKWKNK
jgi:hypothetical protein